MIMCIKCGEPAGKSYYCDEHKSAKKRIQKIVAKKSSGMSGAGKKPAAKKAAKKASRKK